MPRTLRTLTIAATLTTVALLGLTACTGAPAAETSSGSSNGSTSSDGTGSSQQADATGDDGQSTEAACALVQDTITEATDGFATADDDPAAVVDAMKAAAGKLAESSSQITNDEVAALVPNLQEMFAKTSEAMAALVAGDTSKVEDLTELSASLQQTSEEFQQLCTP